MKSNGCVTLLNILHINLQQPHYLLSELILTPFCQFDIKYKTSGEWLYVKRLTISCLFQFYFLFC